MTRFLESPTPAILIGLGLGSVLVIVFLQTRRVAALGGIVLVVLLTIAAVVVERVVVTEREEIEATIYGIAAAAEANDIPGVLAYLAPEAKYIRGLVNRHMPNSVVEKARILSRLTITIDNDAWPPTASAEFIGFVSGKWGRDRINAMQRANIEATFEKTGDRWIITEATGIED